jgi:hypothetical protein
MKKIFLLLIVQLVFAIELPKLNVFASSDSIWVMVDLPLGSEITANKVKDKSSYACHIEVNHNDSWEFGEWVYPEAEQHFYEKLNYTKSIFKNDFIIKSKINKTGMGGELEFNFQSCQGGLCLAPEKVRVSLPK